LVVSLIFYSNLQETIIVPFYYFIFDTLIKILYFNIS
jgi:hypothetical protein